MNWKLIVGVLLLLVGVWVLYVASRATGSTAWSAGSGGLIWMLVGIFLIARNRKKQTNS